MYQIILTMPTIFLFASLQNRLPEYSLCSRIYLYLSASYSFIFVSILPKKWSCCSWLSRSKKAALF